MLERPLPNLAKNNKESNRLLPSNLIATEAPNAIAIGFVPH